MTDDAARRLILWDIDGTLVRVGEIGAEVFDRAIEHTLGVRPPARVAMSGKTDPQIVREYLAMLELVDHEEQVPAILGRLEAETAAAEHVVRAQGVVLPGVEALLARLAGDGGFVQSVLSGNLAPNAVVKLAAFGLERYLDLEIGAYGSDHWDRTVLVPLALARARERRGLTFDVDQVWVVGDSANDLECARAGGVRCALVATGRGTPRRARRLGPRRAVRRPVRHRHRGRGPAQLITGPSRRRGAAGSVAGLRRWRRGAPLISRGAR